MPFIKAFALLVCTGEFSEVRLFLRKSRAGILSSPGSRSEMLSEEKSKIP
jgi:hypothetical protein